MLELIELLAWIADIASLNIETMTPARRGICVAFYGLLGLVFGGAGLVPLFNDKPDTGLVFGGLVVSLIGLGFLARIAYGLSALRRLKRGSA